MKWVGLFLFGPSPICMQRGGSRHKWVITAYLKCPNQNQKSKSHRTRHQPFIQSAQMSATCPLTRLALARDSSFSRRILIRPLKKSRSQKSCGVQITTTLVQRIDGCKCWSGVIIRVLSPSFVGGVLTPHIWTAVTDTAFDPTLLEPSFMAYELSISLCTTLLSSQTPTISSISKPNTC